MSTSTRLDYTLTALREQITAKRDRRIKAVEQEFSSARDLAARRDAWRTEQERRVRALARRLKDLRDNELESFSIPSCPSEASRYRPPESERDTEIEKANANYAWAMRRVDGLRAPDGVVSLTPNMLRDWFGL